MHGTDLVPILRGVSHQWAFWCALVAATTLVALSPPGTPRLAALVYGAGLCTMLAASALYHRYKCGPRVRMLLCRIDHSAIYVFMAASFTPVGLLLLEGTVRWMVLGTVWGAALAGVALSVAWVTAPRVLFALSYVALGWAMVIAFPQLLSDLDAAPLILFGAGGLLYSAGAVIYALQRPDPWPHTFGFHEIFHALVIAAAVAHFVAMAGWVIPAGA
ncbi:MAG TPA: hemolysin III family protein [Solirubrobacteraceae bacterium]|nr:hemolysin III family protein [Solirubrobacteraceae bacterium]